MLDRFSHLGFVFFEDMNVDCRYVRQCRTRYICLAANSICFHFVQARYEINPSFAKQTYRATAISSCVSNISKIPQGIYLDVLQEITKNAQHTPSVFCKFRPLVEIISSRTEEHVVGTNCFASQFPLTGNRSTFHMFLLSPKIFSFGKYFRGPLLG